MVTDRTPAERPAETRRALRVLVADDMPVNLRAAATALKTLGHGGVLVRDGQQVLDALRRERFDLLLLDVTMPVLDGLEALRLIREDERAGGRRLPVIIVSGHDLPEDREHFLSVGADGMVAKPVEAAALAAELRRVLQR